MKVIEIKRSGGEHDSTI